jgi:hypothetical protein
MVAGRSIVISPREKASTTRADNKSISHLMLDLLEWLGRRQRAY